MGNFMGAVLNHASLLEVLWLIMASSGFMAGLINVLDARYDAKRYANAIPVQRFISRVAYLHARLVLSTLIFVSYGAIFSVLTEPPPPPLMERPQALNNTIVWIVVSTLLATKAMLGIRWRKKLELGRYNGDHEQPLQHRRANDPKPRIDFPD